MKARMPLAEAEATAAAFISNIIDCAVRYEIAGSVRRRKEYVGDIEVVAEPAFQKDAQVSLFGEVVGAGTNLLTRRMQELLRLGIIQEGDRFKDGKRAPFSDRHLMVKFKGCPIDLYSIFAPAAWFPSLVIRTGCADFSHWLVTHSQAVGVFFRDGHMEKDGKVLETHDEFDVFFLAGIQYIEPENRGQAWMYYIHETRDYLDAMVLKGRLGKPGDSPSNP